MRGIFIIAALSSAILPLCGDTGKNDNPLRLQLPPALYAVPDVETNVYFDNIVLTINPDNYVFDVDCPKGRNDAKRWRFTPKAEDVGEHPWKVRVLDSANQVVAQGETKLVVSPAKAGEGGKVSLMPVGDSLTDATVYPRRIKARFDAPGNPALKFVGSHAGGGRPAGADGVCHEGYGGWAWGTFLSQWTESEPSYRAKSKFLALKDGKPTFDFQAYLDKNNQGAAPDFITVMLGTNDVFGATDDNLDTAVKSVLTNMDKLLAELRRAAPQAEIGVALTPPPARSQDAFGNNYLCGQTRWQFKRNQHRLVQEMVKKFAANADTKLSLVPVCVNLDCENGFPAWDEPIVAGDKEKVKRQGNGVHPAERGYGQIGDTFYCWMKSRLARQATPPPKP